jgi:hypothetical protein
MVNYYILILVSIGAQIMHISCNHAAFLPTKIEKIELETSKLE